MDHTRASVLSVCTAAIIGAGASAGGLEEGAGVGGPTDWLDCGVRYITPAEREGILKWAAGPEHLEYLSLGSDAVPGIPNVVFRNWFEFDPENETQVIALTAPVGTLIPTHTGRQAGEATHVGQVHFSDGIPELNEGQGLPNECQPELICGCWGSHGEWQWRISNIAGLLQMNDGSSMYVIGTQKEYTISATGNQNGIHSERAFVPKFTARTIPLVQDSAALESWISSRSLAANGITDLTEEEVDRLHSIPYQQDTYDELFHSCMALCMNDFRVQERNAIRRLEDRIKRCRDQLTSDQERAVILLGGVAGCGTVGGGVGGGVGGAIGAGIGTIFCPGAGTAGGFLLGLKWGAAIGACVGVASGVPVCESWILDDEANREEVARCEGIAYLDYLDDVRLLDGVLDDCLHHCEVSRRYNGCHPGTGQ